MSAPHDGARGDVRKARTEARPPEDAAVVNGHRVYYRAHRYECVSCGARLMSVMQFQGRECRPAVRPPAPIDSERSARSLSDLLRSAPDPMGWRAGMDADDYDDLAAALTAAGVGVLADAKATALRDTADELWRVFLRLQRTPSPVGDYVHGRVLAFREAAARLESEASR